MGFQNFTLWSYHDGRSDFYSARFVSYDIGCLRQDGILLSFSRQVRSLASLPLRPPPEKTVNLSLLSPRPASRNTRDFEWRGGVPPLNCKFPPCSLFRLDCARRCCALRRVDRLSRLARSSFSTCSPHLKMSHITADPIKIAQGLSTSIYHECHASSPCFNLNDLNTVAVPYRWKAVRVGSCLSSCESMPLSHYLGKVAAAQQLVVIGGMGRRVRPREY